MRRRRATSLVLRGAFDSRRRVNSDVMLIILNPFMGGRILRSSPELDSILFVEFYRHFAATRLVVVRNGICP